MEEIKIPLSVSYDMLLDEITRRITSTRVCNNPNCDCGEELSARLSLHCRLFELATDVCTNVMEQELKSGNWWREDWNINW